MRLNPERSVWRPGPCSCVSIDEHALYITLRLDWGPRMGGVCPRRTSKLLGTTDARQASRLVDMTWPTGPRATQRGGQTPVRRVSMPDTRPKGVLGWPNRVSVAGGKGRWPMARFVSPALAFSPIQAGAPHKEQSVPVGAGYRPVPQPRSMSLHIHSTYIHPAWLPSSRPGSLHRTSHPICLTSHVSTDVLCLLM